MYILDEDYLQIEIKDNKLIYYSELDIIPTETQFKEAEEALLNYFTAIDKKKNNILSNF